MSNDAAAEKFSYESSRSLESESKMLMMIFLHYLNLHQMSHIQKIEKELERFSEKMERLEFLFCHYFKDLAGEAVQLLVKGAKAAGKCMHSQAAYATV